MTLPDPPILVITDRRQCPEPLEARAAALFAGGCRWLSLREKNMDPAERLALLRRLTELGRGFGATVGIHDDIAAARKSGSALHLPANADCAEARQILGASALIGQSCHNRSEIAAACGAGASYVTLSPIFATASKPGYIPALDLTEQADLATGAAIPVLALGGITLVTLPRLNNRGFGGVAVMGEAMAAPNPRSWFETLLARWNALKAASVQDGFAGF